MSAHNSPILSMGTSLQAAFNVIPSRRSSAVSLSGLVPSDKEQLAQALDKIHNTASHSATLTTFNEFASPPSSGLNTEGKGLAGDFMQNGLSGLYNRLRDAVGAVKDKTSQNPNMQAEGNIKKRSSKRQRTGAPALRNLTPALPEESILTIPQGQVSSSSSRLQSPTFSPYAGQGFEDQFQLPRSSKSSVGSSTTTTTPTPAITKSRSSGRTSLTSTNKAITFTAGKPAVAPCNISVFKDDDISRQIPEIYIAEPSTSAKLNTCTYSPALKQCEVRQKKSSADESPAEDKNKNEFVIASLKSAENLKVLADSDSHSEDRSTENPHMVSGTANMINSASSSSSLRVPEANRGSSMSSLDKRSATGQNVSHSRLPSHQAFRSSTNRSIAEASPVNTSAHNSVRHGSFSVDEGQQQEHHSKGRIPGTTTNEGAPEVVNARLEQMKRQVLSKEFWMADIVCKECFLCNVTFSAFRRKHHCRTCGCIFDAKCTSIIPGQRFGVHGSLRVCNTCLDIINRRHDSSGSDDSADDSIQQTFYQSQPFDHEISTRLHMQGHKVNSLENESFSGLDNTRPLATPMMAIPATRRFDGSASQRSAVLEIDVPQMARPSSSKSPKAPSASARPPSSGHKRHHSKHNLIGRIRSTIEERPPFHGGIVDDLARRSKLPAFHDDNIIDPDLAPYMSDEGSSGDEQTGIFTTMNNSTIICPSLDNDRSVLGSFLSTSKRNRTKTGEKSISGVSFSGRNLDENSGNASTAGFSRPNRRRNLSTSSNNLLFARVSPRQQFPGFGNLDEKTNGSENSSTPPTFGTTRITRSASMRDSKAPALTLNSTSLCHVRRLLHQLLKDAQIPNLASWEKALVPILLRCTDDVDPNVRSGDDIDIRHYVKLKRIPGGKPGDTAYVSGVVFTKNLALKSMPRTISNPRIVILSFPIEYVRQQHHFMSLEPVITQEKEYLRNMANRIASLRPQLLLVQKTVSGLALQYLSEANIAVAYNVKKSVIEAVSRCAQTEVISSIDILALKPVHIGKSAGFDLKTYVHDDIPCQKKTYVYLSGCSKELGCTIVLRGANMATLSKMKRITEFMVYVVYNLKLETCLMHDEFVHIPPIAENNDSAESNSTEASVTNPGYSDLSSPTTIPATMNGMEKEPATSSDDQAEDYTVTAVTNPGYPDLSTPIAIPATMNDMKKESELSDDKQIEYFTITEIPSERSPKQTENAHLLVDDQSFNEEERLPEDIPMPTFYSDMIAKYQTKILSASPFVKFMQPYLLMQAREQERRLTYFKRLRDQDNFEELTEVEKSLPQKFQLIKPEMVHDPVKGAPRQIMEVLHAVHDAEYDKALHNYQTQKRQWENYLQGSLDLFEPYAHQKITVLHTVVCTATSIPCADPELLTLSFYDEHAEFDPDSTLGQYIEDLCLSANSTCASHGCERKMWEHHRTYVHGEARITVFVENFPCKLKDLQESILMWNFCKICQKETPVMPMSENTWKYSLGKYLELSFWSSGLHSRAGICPHDIHRDHLRYFGYRNFAIRIHYDPIDLLEIVVPRTRITWKVEHDLRLKNEIFNKFEERWNRFMSSVHSRIKGINIHSVSPEKADACKSKVEILTKRAQEEHGALIRKLQQKYMESKYYEVIPLNRAVRAMQEKVVEWDVAFAEFDADFFPSEKDIRRLAKKMFMDRVEASPSTVSVELTDLVSDLEEKSLDVSPNFHRNQAHLATEEARDYLSFVAEETQPNTPQPTSDKERTPTEALVKQEYPNPTSESNCDDIDTAYPTLDNFVQKSSSPIILPIKPSDLESAAQHPSSSSIESLPPEKLAGLRKAHSPNVANAPSLSEGSGIPRPAERVLSRRSGTTTSPSFMRTQSQPSVVQLRKTPSVKVHHKQADQKSNADMSTLPSETGAEMMKTTDQKFSERMSLGTIKAHRKAGHSMIPRSVQNKRKDSKVSTMAKHFEQLSREFEKERLRDREQREARVSQSRVFPQASSKPMVEVYEDANEAAEERLLIDSQSGITSLPVTLGESENLPISADSGVLTPAQTITTADEAAHEAEYIHHTVSQTGSDDDYGMSEPDHFLLDGTALNPPETTETINVEKPNAELPIDLPKHEKTSLMKMLTNFWAERSASGWTPLDYPVSAGDHIFADVDVIVREDEPSSLIAFTLQTQDYKDKLSDIRSQGHASGKKEDVPHIPHTSEAQNLTEDGLDQAEVETSLLRATGTHLSYSFVDRSARMQCKIFFAEQFDAVRRKCGVSERIVESLSRCLKWDSKGGKTKSVFLKTLDDRLVLKSLSPIETAAFLKFAPAYFNIMAEALFHDLPTVIAKLLGFYQIIIKNPITGTEIKWNVLLMENLFYDRSPTRIFDLKGSMRNRKIQSTGEQNEVLLDENMVEFIYESPLFTREHSKKLLRNAIFNDTLFLQKNDVMDYSLMIAVDEARKELVVGIIDVVRTYTWDKKLESWIKDRGFAGGGRNRPTVTSPKEYKSRFREAMDRYILQAPNSWHQWQQVEPKPQKNSQAEVGNNT
ncbi:1-phosphatidylinositol 3-phosphate 5-kinase [Podosphaera aphanis]|nr:1-phosphatidylinositol 3-phosphate 5-kinase [Podosphaera aphanis]